MLFLVTKTTRCPASGCVRFHTPHCLSPPVNRPRCTKSSTSGSRCQYHAIQSVLRHTGPGRMRCCCGFILCRSPGIATQRYRLSSAVQPISSRSRPLPNLGAPAVPRRLRVYPASLFAPMRLLSLSSWSDGCTEPHAGAMAIPLRGDSVWTPDVRPSPGGAVSG